MADHGKDKSSRPLRGCVITCTSIPAEQRTSIAGIVTEMGAVHKLDLTSDVTHLIVGQVDTPKYKYVARERSDVHVVSPEWVEAVRQEWLQGGETDVAALETKFRLPTFFGLLICMTGFDNLEERANIARQLEEQGGKFTCDLTRHVTHLIAVRTSGRKYEHAAQWGKKIVSLAWFADSLERGMVLDELLYHPSIPASEQGKGAVNTEKKEEITQRLGKRDRDPNVDQDAAELAGKRKLRRTVSSKLESQNDDFWADIGTSGTDQAGRAAAVIGRDAGGFDDIDAAKRISVDQGTDRISRAPSTTAAISIAKEAEQMRPSNASIFRRPGSTAPEKIFMQGFSSKKSEILRSYLETNGAVVLAEDEMLARFPSSSSVEEETDPRDAMESHSAVTVVIPYTTPATQTPHFQSENAIAPVDLYVTDFWVEKCLHAKRVIPHATPLCEPFKHDFPLSTMSSLTICPTGFSGADLLHFSKAVKLCGAMYDEYLRPETSVLVVRNNSHQTTSTNMSYTQREKLEYALKNHIPIVSADWLYTCLDKGTKQPFEQFGLVKLVAAGFTHLQFFHPDNNPRPGVVAGKRSASKPLTRVAHATTVAKPKRSDGIDVERSWSESKTETGVSFSKAEYNERSRSRSIDTTILKPKSSIEATEKKSPVLQELPPAMNSSPKRKHTPPIPQDPAKADLNLEIESKEEENFDAAIPPTQRTTNLNNAIAELLAQKRSTHTNIQTNTNPNVTNQASEATHPVRRHRPLGRAVSNGSTSASPFERSSAQRDALKQAEAGSEVVEDSFDHEADSFLASPRRKTLEQFRPSQALSYEDPEAAAVRDKLLRKALLSRDCEGSKGANMSATDKIENEEKGFRVASIGTVKNLSTAPGGSNYGAMGAAAAAGRRRGAARGR